MRIGVLALQGAFIEHIRMLQGLGVDAFELRQGGDLHMPMDGLILPGGESTVMAKLLRACGLFTRLRALVEGGLPVFGTCAGLLLLAKNVGNGGVAGLATMDINAKRNAYGRQLGSFFTTATFSGAEIPMTFIRAPYIEAVGDGVEILAQVGGRIVAARQGNQLVTAFHPEVGGDFVVHGYFVGMCGGRTRI